MTTPPMCDRLLIWIVAAIVVAALAAAFALEFSGHAGASAAFVGVAMAALGILSPSPLKQHNQGGASVDAGPSGTVTVNTAEQPAEPDGV